MRIYHRIFEYTSLSAVPFARAPLKSVRLQWKSTVYTLICCFTGDERQVLQQIRETTL
jgi:hypothetical protein